MLNFGLTMNQIMGYYILRDMVFNSIYLANLSKDKGAKLWVYRQFVHDCQVAVAFEANKHSAF